MEAAANLQELRPELKRCKVITEGPKLIVEALDHDEQLILPRNYYPILRLLNGKRSVADIVSALYESEGKVSFNSVMTALDLLKSARLLAGGAESVQSSQQEKTPHQQKPSILMRPLLEIPLVPKIKWEKQSEVLFSFFVVLVAAVVVIAPLGHFWQVNFGQFLRSSGHYHQAIFLLWGVSSLLMNLKNISKIFMLLLSTGQLYSLSIRVHWYGVTISSSQNSIYAQKDTVHLLAYGVGSALLYLFWGMVLCFLFPRSPYLNDVKLLCMLLTFIELDPYRKSELTRLFNFFYAEDQLKNLVPYLKNCSLFSVFYQREKIQGEIRYLIYSIIAMAWAVCFTLFSLDLLAQNVPPLMKEVLGGVLLGKISASLVLLLISFIFCYLSIDLLQTVFGNVLNPLFVPFFGLFRRAKSKGSVHFDAAQIKAVLQQNIFFSSLSPASLDFLLKHSALKKFSKGSPLIVQGENGQEVFVLLSGSVEVEVREKTGLKKVLATLSGNTVIGELSILKNTLRTANVNALENVMALEIQGSTFRELTQRPEFAQDFQKISERIELCQFVSSAGLFKDFPAEIIHLFIRVGTLERVPANTWVVKQGDHDKSFYLLIRGEVEVLKGESVVAKLQQGDFFGEIALIANVARTASIHSLSECMFLKIESDAFWKILSANLDLAMYIEAVGQQRQGD